MKTVRIVILFAGKQRVFREKFQELISSVVTENSKISFQYPLCFD